MKRKNLRESLFDLGDFYVDQELLQLLPEAELQRLVLRHARGDWGLVSEHRKKQNAAFIRPKNRALGSYAQSLHITKGVQVCILTKQARGRRQTRLFIV